VSTHSQPGPNPGTPNVECPQHNLTLHRGMTMAMTFKKAERRQSKLRLAISGPSGSGKTYGALLIASGLGGRIAVIDTERGSASLYSSMVDFDVSELSPPYNPERFVEGIRDAEAAGYDTIILDSMTHEWDGSGGCLEMNERIANTKFKGNTYAAWSETTPRHRSFLDAILQSKANIIATLRSKTDTVQEGGKVKKVGMKNVQRDGTDYEFTTVLDLIHDSHYATASKDRTGLFKEPHIITTDTGKRILAWQQEGVPLLPIEKPRTQQAPYEPTEAEIAAVIASAQSLTSAMNVARLSYGDILYSVNLQHATNYTDRDKFSTMTHEEQKYAGWVLLVEIEHIKRSGK